jgi:hypothetical protein
MVSVYMAMFNTLHSAHTLYYVFHKMPTTDNYFPVQHLLIGFNNVSTLCSPENRGLSLSLLLQPAHVLISDGNIIHHPSGAHVASTSQILISTILLFITMSTT